MVIVAGAALALGVALGGGCTPQQPPAESASTGTSAPPSGGGVPASPSPAHTGSPSVGGYAWHRDILATTFWVGEIFDPDAADGSQQISTYDSDWLASYGGCDGVQVGGECRTEPRAASNGYFPSAMTPRENPFYLDVPYDDVNDAAGFAMRDTAIPWAGRPPYSKHSGDRGFSYLKNRWVEIVHEGRTCFGQIQDAGPGVYDDARYVFGEDDARPASTRYGGAGLDVSPALTGCLAFPELDGMSARVDWRFVEAGDVPPGPWTLVITTSQVR